MNDLIIGCDKWSMGFVSLSNISLPLSLAHSLLHSMDTTTELCCICETISLCGHWWKPPLFSQCDYQQSHSSFKRCYLSIYLANRSSLAFDPFDFPTCLISTVTHSHTNYIAIDNTISIEREIENCNNFFFNYFLCPFFRVWQKVHYNV